MRRVIIITGDREWTPIQWAVGHERLKHLQKRDIFAFVVLGDAPGVDSLARVSCENLRMSHAVEYAFWHVARGGAGPERNGRMLTHGQMANALTGIVQAEVWAFHDHLATLSKGTRNCVDQALQFDMPVWNYTSDGRIFRPYYEHDEGPMLLDPQEH